MSITPVHPRIGVMAYDWPGSGERTSNEPKYVRWRGGHFSAEIFTSNATSDCVSTAHLTLEFMGMAGGPLPCPGTVSHSLEKRPPSRACGSPRCACLQMWRHPGMRLA